MAEHSVTPSNAKRLQVAKEPSLILDDGAEVNAYIEDVKHTRKTRSPSFTIVFAPPKYYVTPEDSKHTQTVTEQTTRVKLVAIPENAIHRVISEEYEITYPIGILQTPATRILIDFLFGDGEHRYSTEDLYITEGGLTYEYWRRLKESPDILKELSNWFYGRPKDDTITLEFDNSDGYFTTYLGSVECRKQRVKIRRYEPSEKNASDVITHEVTAIITSYEFDASLLKIDIATQDPDLLQTVIPTVLYTTDSWTDSPPLNINPTFDLGKPYPLAFGLAHRVPLVYIHADFTNDNYDYIISHGPIEDVIWVYRDGVKVNPSEYTLVKNDAVTYNGYAYIRFKVEQMTFNQGTMYSLTADVKGMTFGNATCERNFVNVIKNILSNATWGLGETVNATSFNVASYKVSDLYCDGYIAEQKRTLDVLDKLLLACRGKLDKNEIGEWIISIDSPVITISQTFGLNDGYYNNMSLKRIYKTPVAEAIKQVQLNYRYNTWENTYMMKNERDVLDFGEVLTLENKFVWDHGTADRITCFLEQMYEMSDDRADITADLEGRMLREYNTVKVLVPHLSVSETYQVRSIKRGLSKFDMTLVKHANTIYTYNAQTLPVDEQEENLPDFIHPDAPTYEKPKVPINISGLSWSFKVDNSGSVTAILLGQAQKDPDDINFQCIMVGTRMYDATNTVNYKWVTASKYGVDTEKFIGPFGIGKDLYRVVLDFPASTYPGGGAFEGGGGAYLYFDEAVKYVNVFGQESDWVLLPHEQIPFKDVGTNDVSSLVQKINGKTFNWSWDKTEGYPTGTNDIQDYHVQVATVDDFTTTLIDTFTGATTYTYTSTASFGAQLFFRVRARNTTLIESWNWTTATGEVGDSDENGVNILYLPVCSTVTAGDFVNIYAVLGASPCVRKADATTVGKEAHGFVLSTVGTGSVKVFLSGNVNYKVHGTTGTLLTGGYMYLSDTVPGDFKNTPPTTATYFVQKLGLPISVVGSTMNFLFIYHEPVILA